MDIEMTETTIRMKGKAWQIRAKLREWSKHPMLLHEFLTRQKNRQSSLR
jgi:hypothetical protein